MNTKATLYSSPLKDVFIVRNVNHIARQVGKTQMNDAFLKSKRPPMTITQQELIDEILDQFDFQKVKEVMDALNWTWAIGTESHVPDIPELRKQAREMLWDAIRSKHRMIKTGGFVAEKEDDDTLELRFEVTSWNTWDSFPPDTIVTK